ncbi:MAG: hypothetical protein AseanaTS_26850 [Candidatus Pelagadaptatus aseana]
MSFNIRQILGVSVLALLLTGCIDDSAKITDCAPVGDRVPLCGWQSPEDMELLPDGRTLIVSEMEQQHGAIYGRLSLLDSVDSSKVVLNHQRVQGDERWGSADCKVPPTDYLAPHGIHLSKRADDRWQLLVVNHGTREAIEFYEVTQQDGMFDILWRGCAEPPAQTFFNDVVALPEGGLMATHMFPKPEGKVGTLSWAEARALLGFNPGHLLHWDGEVFKRVGDFSGDYPNGLQISPDGDTLFINLWLNSKVIKFDRHEARVIAEADILHPDNTQWSADGKLLVASHDFTLGDIRLCLSDGRKACPGLFRVIELDPETMQTRQLLSQSGAPMGAGTVVQQVDDQLFVGSFLGDRILRIPHPD